MNLELLISTETIMDNADKEMLYHYLSHTKTLQWKYNAPDEKILVKEVELEDEE